MASCCLICNSRAVVTRDVAEAAVLTIGTFASFLRGVREARAQAEPSGRDEDLCELLTRGVASILSGHANTLEFASDMQRYQFSHYHCLCLRCGARFDHEPCLGL